jgi:hypothetical protein
LLRRRFLFPTSWLSARANAMPKPPQNQPWAIYHIKGTPAKLVGIADKRATVTAPAQPIRLA